MDGWGAAEFAALPGSTTDGGLPTLYVGDEVQDWIGQAADAYTRNTKSTTKTRMSRAISGSVVKKERSV